MSLSCIPCAKRKVKCDRTTPACSNCRKRQGDVCEYPIPHVKASRPSMEEQTLRIAKLEQYVRAFGGNPDYVERDLNSGPNRPNEHSMAAGPPTINQQDVNRGTKRKADDDHATTIPSLPRSDPRAPRQTHLVEHDEQTTYIEAPMWYSWNEAKQISSEAPERSDEQHNRQATLTARCDSLLDPVSTGSRVELDTKHPSTYQIQELWRRHLKNVHPLVKIFFDWEKEPLIHKAAHDPAALSRQQNAFMFAMYFITAISLTDKECREVMNGMSKAQLLDDFQSSAETALLAAGFMATGDLLVLQAVMLYLLAMRDRARPATWFSLQGIAVRIAQRLGLHRDGSFLGLSPFHAEERRRVWWHLQHQEIMVCVLVGCLSMTVYGHWDNKMPGNFEDGDFRLDMDAPPSPRPGLTSMSNCLWRYTLLEIQREQRMLQPEHEIIVWAVSPNISAAEKDSRWEPIEKAIGEKFLLQCDLLDPLQLHMQIQIRSCFIASRRLSRQPGLSNARILDMPKREREELLQMNIKNLEYYVLSETTPSIEHFRWHNVFFFQWTAFVFVLLEAHYRAATSDAVSLWTLIDKVCRLHPSFIAPLNQPGIATMGRLVVLAWGQRRKHLESLGQDIEKPGCVTDLEEKLDFHPGAPNASSNDGPWLASDFMPSDFDMIDWSFLEKEMGPDIFG